MKLEYYNPRYNRTLVYIPNNDNILTQIDGIVSVFFFALLNDYSFVIEGLDKTHLADIFDSTIDWWDSSWKDSASKRGLWNLNNPTESDIFNVKNVYMEKMFPYSEIIHISTNENWIPHLLDSEAYRERFEYLGILEEKNVYLSCLQLLFSDFTEQFADNFESLYQDFTEEEDRMVARIVTMENIDEVVDEIKQLNVKKLLLSTNDFKIVNYLQKTMSDIEIISISDIKDDNMNPLLIQNVKVFYELFLFLSSNVRYVTPEDKFSNIVLSCS